MPASRTIGALGGTDCCCWEKSNIWAATGANSMGCTGMVSPTRILICTTPNSFGQPPVRPRRPSGSPLPPGFRSDPASELPSRPGESAVRSARRASDPPRGPGGSSPPGLPWPGGVPAGELGSGQPLALSWWLGPPAAAVRPIW